MRLALATFPPLPDGPADEAELVEALAAEGVEAVRVPWQDPGVDWSRFDAVNLRSPWDYPGQAASFLAWLEKLEALGIQLQNPLPVLRWAMDKHYLFALEAKGVRIVPTRLLSPPLPPLAQAMAEAGWDEAVLKPAVSSAGSDTLRFRQGEADAHQGPAEALAQARGPLLLQPFLASVLDEGEWSLNFVSGGPGQAMRYSHAVLKHPCAGEFRVQEHHGGQTLPAQAPAALEAAARRVLEAAQGCLAEAGHPGLVWNYARVDGLWDGRDFALMELEAVEPSLYLNHDPEATTRLAQAIAADLRSGLAIA